MDEKRITRQGDIPEGLFEDRGLSEEILETELSSDGDVDVPEALEKWKDETKGFQRVARVAMALPEPKTAKWIGDQALVSEQSAREHLEFFADLGIVASEKSGSVTRYKADETFAHYREVSKVRKEYSPEEISELVEGVQEEIHSLKEKYEVDSASQLRIKATESEDVEDVREFTKAASRLEAFVDQLMVYRDSLSLYERFSKGKEVPA